MLKSRDQNILVWRPDWSWDQNVGRGLDRMASFNISPSYRYKKK